MQPKCSFSVWKYLLMFRQLNLVRRNFVLAAFLARPNTINRIWPLELFCISWLCSAMHRSKPKIGRNFTMIHSVWFQPNHTLLCTCTSFCLHSLPTESTRLWIINEVTLQIYFSIFHPKIIFLMLKFQNMTSVWEPKAALVKRKRSDEGKSREEEPKKQKHDRKESHSKFCFRCQIGFYDDTTK